MGPYDRDDAAKDTDATRDEVDAAYHDARDAYEDLYGVDDRHGGGWNDHVGIEADRGD